MVKKPLGNSGKATIALVNTALITWLRRQSQLGKSSLVTWLRPHGQLDRGSTDNLVKATLTSYCVNVSNNLVKTDKTDNLVKPLGNLVRATMALINAALTTWLRPH